MFARFLTFIISAIFLTYPVSNIAYAAKNKTDEANLRAAVIIGILRFTQFDRLIENTPSFKLCLVAKPLSSKKILQYADKVQIKKKSINVYQITKPQDIKEKSCSVVIFGQDTSDVWFQEKQSSGHFLSICDNCSFSSNTAINLIRRNKRIGFEIQLRPAKQNKIIFSSSLLELAANIEE